MAIHWTESTYSKETQRWERDPSKDRTTHVGLVLEPPSRHEIRVMSDVWADQITCVVWNPEKSCSERLDLWTNFENDTKGGRVEVDATPEIRALYEAEKVAKAEAHRIAAEKEYERERAEYAKQAEQSARRELLAVRKGAECVVTSGRKVKIGTRGFIFWVGDGNYGRRVGIKDDAGATHWTAESNITVVLPGTGPDFVPEGGWVALKEKVDAEKSERNQALPNRNDKVRHLATGQIMKVFWRKDERLGLKHRISDRNEDPLWCNANEVALIGPDGKEVAAGKGPDIKSILAAAVPADSGIVDMDLDDDEPAKSVAPELAAMPAPFCDIRTLERRGADEFAALDASGAFLLMLPAASADQIRKLLED